MKKLLTNQYVIMGIVALVIALIMVATQTNFRCLLFSENCSDTTEISSDNEYYKKLRNDIEEMSKQKWSKTSYNRIKQNINDYAATTPDPLINEEERIGLSNVLDSKYLVLIYDSVVQVLRFGSKSEHIAELDKEIQLFSNNTNDKERLNGIKANIKIYQDVFSWCNTIYSYTANKPYDSYTSEKYKTLVLAFTTEQFLSENKFISDSIGLIDQHIKRLDEHAFMDVKFKNSNFIAGERTNIRRDTCCFCDKDHDKIYYTKYGYYKNLCDSIRLEVIKIGR